LAALFASSCSLIIYSPKKNSNLTVDPCIGIQPKTLAIAPFIPLIPIGTITFIPQVVQLPLLTIKRTPIAWERRADILDACMVGKKERSPLRVTSPAMDYLLKIV